MGNGFSSITKSGLTLVGAILALVLATPVQSAPLSARPTAAVHESVPGEIIVKVKQGPGLSNKAQIHSSLKRALSGVTILEIRVFQTDSRFHTVKIAQPGQVKNAIQILEESSSVEYAEPNYIYRAFDTGVPNDTDFVKLWGMQNTGQPDPRNQIGIAGHDINVAPLWARGVTGSKSVVVAVIDTGIKWDHPDLVDNLYTNPGEVAADGIDNDGNGFIDDIHGWNFNAHTANSNDDHDHGTHCAGTIGGTGNNGLGVAGVNWNVSLMPVKFLSASGSGSSEGAIESVNYARMMKVNVMSNSWGGGPASQALKDAIIAAKDAGILFVAAAGNNGSNNDSSPAYPASYAVENIVAVAAIDNQGKLASFTNTGARSVHVAAPGVNVWSSVKDGSYASFSGTSMACPHVAGIAALMMAGNNTLSFADVKQRLISTSEPMPALARKVVAKGRVNAANAFDNIVPPNNAPDERLWVDEANLTESAHPYGNGLDEKFTITSPGVRYIRIVFEKIETEANYDKIFVQSTAGEVADEITGSVTNYTSSYVMSDSLVIRFQTDVSVNKWGFKVAKIQVIR